MTEISGKCFNYSDCGSGSGLNPAMFWLAKQSKDYSLLFTEKKYLESDKRMHNDRLLPAIMIGGAGINLDDIQSPKKLLWAGKGKNPVVLMRSSWTDLDAIYVAIKGGSPSVSHGHMDIGSFVINAGKERWQVLRYNNFYHNTLTFDDELQRVEGYALITSFSDKPSFINATLDISKVYNGKASSVKRGITIVDNQYVMVRDEIESSDKATSVRWNMVTPAIVKVNEDGTATLTQNGKRLLLKVVSPENATITLRPTTPVHDYDA